MLTKIRRQWFAKRKSIAAILKEVMTNEASALVDTDASNKAADADLALQELGADYAGIAYVTATVTVWDADPRTADEKLRLVEKVIQGRDFTAMAETINAVDAWLGSLPGHVYANVRQPPISTLNLAHMIPLSAVWAGPERDEHFAAPPLLFGKTEGSTPFRFSLHVGDVGHTLIVGPTGAGKSVLLALMALQFRRYPGAQVFAFDFGGSIRAAALAMRGDWHDLGGGLTEGSAASVSLQPLARVDDTAERAWAADWLVAILTRESVAISPEVKEHIWTALTSLASAPVEERTITGLCVLLQSNDLKQALRPYCIGGAWGRLLDAESEHLGTATVQAFETEGLIGTEAAPAVLAYLFHRIEDRLDGSPTLIIVDEGWLALDDEGFRRPAARMAEDATQEERQRHFRYAVPVGHRRLGHRARHHRELPDPASCSPTSARSSRKSPRSTVASASTIARSRSSRGPCPSATITASRGAAIGCSSWVSPRSRCRFAPHPRGSIRPALQKSTPDPAPTASSPNGCARTTSPGPPT